MDSADFHADRDFNRNIDEHTHAITDADDHLDADRDHDECACFQYADIHSDAYCSAIGYTNRGHANSDQHTYRDGYAYRYRYSDRDCH